MYIVFKKSKTKFTKPQKKILPNFSRKVDNFPLGVFHSNWVHSFWIHKIFQNGKIRDGIITILRKIKVVRNLKVFGVVVKAVGLGKFWRKLCINLKKLSEIFENFRKKPFGIFATYLAKITQKFFYRVFSSFHTIKIFWSHWLDLLRIHLPFKLIHFIMILKFFASAWKYVKNLILKKFQRKFGSVKKNFKKCRILKISVKFFGKLKKKLNRTIWLQV